MLRQHLCLFLLLTLFFRYTSLFCVVLGLQRADLQRVLLLFAHGFPLPFQYCLLCGEAILAMPFQDLV